MPKGRFEDMQSVDEKIRQAMLDNNDGQPPDNFIEDAQGGGIDAEHLADQSPEKEDAMRRALDGALMKLRPDVEGVLLEDGSLRSD